MKSTKLLAPGVSILAIWAATASASGLGLGGATQFTGQVTTQLGATTNAVTTPLSATTAATLSNTGSGNMISTAGISAGSAGVGSNAAATQSSSAGGGVSGNASALNIQAQVNTSAGAQSQVTGATMPSITGQTVAYMNTRGSDDVSLRVPHQESGIEALKKSYARSHDEVDTSANRMAGAASQAGRTSVAFASAGSAKLKSGTQAASASTKHALHSETSGSASLVMQESTTLKSKAQVGQ